MHALFYLICTVLGCGACAGLLYLSDWVCSRLLNLLRRRVRPFLRKYRNWERLSLMLLSVSLLFVLILSWLGAAGDPESETHWFFQGIAVTFSVFECDSSDFRGYAVHFSWLYCILACAVPLLTVSTALGLLWEHLPHHVPFFCKVWHIFSEPDAHSILMAKDLSREDHLCIFLRTRRSKLDEDVLTELQDVNYFLYPKDEIRFLRWRRRRSRTLRFYFLSDNTDKNFDRMQDFLTAVKSKGLFIPPEGAGDFRQELFLLSETESAPTLMKDLRKMLAGDPIFRSTELHLLDRFRATSYDLLRRKPLYGPADDGPQGRQLNILVLGFGRIGREFFRAACSLGILPDCSTEFTLCDLEIRTKLSRFLSQCPELDRSVSFRSRTLDAETAELEDLITARDYHYILVALGEDERNIRVASRLKRHYRLHHWQFLDGQCSSDTQPQICVNIEDTIKRDYTKKLWVIENDPGHSLHVFGGLDQVFTESVLMPRDLWTAARYIHQKLTSKQKPISMQISNWGEYERRSSIACAVRAEYLYATIVSRDSDKSYTDLLANYSIQDLAQTEHCRWMAYVRSEGLRKVTPRLAKHYYNIKTGGHVDIPGKLTPCLVDTEDELETIWEGLKTDHPDDYKNKRTFRERDEFVVTHAEVITLLSKPPIEGTDT